MTTKSVFTTYLGENIDRVITLDLRGSGGIHHLYSAARIIYGGPVCLFAAQKIKDYVKPNDVVLITTGTITSPPMIGETDGPLGAAALARILSLGLEARVIVLTEEVLVGIVKAACRGAGLNIVKASDLAKGHESDIGKVSVSSFPIDEEEAKRETEQLLSLWNPKAIIAIEKVGPNHLGIYHCYGLDFSSYHSKIGILFSKTKQNRILSIGIGDRGNEIGLGTIKDVAQKVHPYGSKCRCPCKGGAADNTIVDIVVPASVSNWGAYGIETCLAILLEKIELIHDENIEIRMLRLCVDAGGVDGITGLCEPAVDGFSENIHANIVGMLRTISKNNFRPIPEDKIELYRIP